MSTHLYLQQRMIPHSGAALAGATGATLAETVIGVKELVEGSIVVLIVGVLFWAVAFGFTIDGRHYEMACLDSHCELVVRDQRSNSAGGAKPATTWYVAPSRRSSDADAVAAVDTSTRSTRSPPAAKRVRSGNSLTVPAPSPVTPQPPLVAPTAQPHVEEVMPLPDSF